MKLLKWIVVSVFSAAILLALAIIADGLTDDVRSSDIAIILGSKVELDGHPSARLAARLDTGLALYRTGATKVLMVSGGTGVEGFSEAIVMRDYLYQLGVPLSDIIVDENGFNTDDTAKNCAAFMRVHGLKSVIVVTQYFHVSRTKMALKFYGVGTVYSAHAAFVELRDMYSIAREVVALPVVWLQGLYLRFSA